MINEARQHQCFTGIYGLVHGIEGGLNEEFIDLTREDEGTLRRLLRTPASALGSSRYKVQDEDYERLIHVFRAHEIRYFTQIGGNGSMYVCHQVAQIAQHMGYELQVIGVPKTIDNDLAGTDHAPGYGSAARFLAIATRDVGRDLEAMATYEDVMILETLGRDAGWLAAASALLKKHDDEAPHLIYVPEIAFDEARFLEDVQRVHSRLGRVFVVIGEGIRDTNGSFVAQSNAPTDTLGRVVYALSTGASNELAVKVRQHLGLQVRLLRPGLIGRDLSACVSPVDRQEATLVGTAAAQYHANGLSHYMVTLERLETPSSYSSSIGRISLAEISGQEKLLPRHYMNAAGNMVTPAFYAYALPLIGNIARLGRLQNVRVAKRF